MKSTSKHRSIPTFLATATAAFLLTHTSSQAVSVSLELSLVVDVSGSVDASEYTQQIEGYSSAFESASIHSAISGSANGIAINMIQFSSTAAESIPWTHLTDAASSNAFATQVRSAARLFTGGTNIDAGINEATTSLNNNTFTGKRSVIDVSGDGTGANGSARDNALANGVDTINGIVISDSSGSLKTHYENEVIGGQGAFVATADTFADFEPKVLSKIEREITNVNNVTDEGFPVAAALRQTQITVVQAGLADVNSRLFRLRTRRAAPAPAPIVPSSDKGGYSDKGDSDSAKGVKAPILAPPTPKRWEAYGSLHAHTEEVDGSNIALAGTALVIPTLPDYEIDIYGGTVGVEYAHNQNWSFGGAVVGNNADIDMGSYGDIETDGYAIALYASYYRENAFGGQGDWYADFLYSYGAYDNDIKRVTNAGIANGSTESENHTVAVNTGYNLHSGDWIHGPFGSLSYTDGELDSYTETGPGAATFPSMSYESLLGRIGYKVAKVISTSRGNVIPQLRLAWEHEFENEPSTIGTFPLGVPDEDRLMAGAGVVWEFSENGRAILNYEARFADDHESHRIGLGISYKF